MKSALAPLTVAAALLLIFDVWMFFDIYQFGFPPNDLLYPDGSIPVASTSDKVAYALFLFVFALGQSFLFRLTWKAWRR